MFYITICSLKLRQEGSIF